MVLQSKKTGCVWKTPFRKSGHNFRILGHLGHNVSNTVQLDSNDLVHVSDGCG